MEHAAQLSSPPLPIHDQQVLHPLRTQRLELLLVVLELEREELRHRIALLVQPIGEDHAVAFVVGRFSERLVERAFVHSSSVASPADQPEQRERDPRLHARRSAAAAAALERRRKSLRAQRLQ